MTSTSIIASLADWTKRIHTIVKLAQDTDVPDPASALEFLAPALSPVGAVHVASHDKACSRIVCPR